MASFHALDVLLHEQSEKVDQLRIATTLINKRKQIKDELIESQLAVSHMRKELDGLRNNLSKLHDENNSIKELLVLLHKLQESIIHMQKNVPPKLLHDYSKINAGELARSPKEPESPSGGGIENGIYVVNNDNLVTNCAKTLFNEPDVYPRMELITEMEFKRIPKYMIGRQSLELLNSFLSSINEILKAKYSLLAKGKDVARKRGEYDLYMNYKKQQTMLRSEEDLYFFNSADYHHYMKKKLDKTKFNLITALRHCKRLRELRMGKDIQYVVVTS